MGGEFARLEQHQHAAIERHDAVGQIEQNPENLVQRLVKGELSRGFENDVHGNSVAPRGARGGVGDTTESWTRPVCR